MMRFEPACNVGQQWRGRESIVRYQRSRSPVTLALVGMCPSACLRLLICYFAKSSKHPSEDKVSCVALPVQIL